MRLIIEIDDLSAELLLRADPSYIAWGDGSANSDERTWTTDEEKYTPLISVRRYHGYGISSD